MSEERSSEDTPSQDQRYDEAAVTKMAALWAQMYYDLTLRGVPPKFAIRLVLAWIRNTLGKG